MAEKRGSMSGISRVIDEWFDTKKYSKKRNNYNAFHNWSEIVGPDISRNTEPHTFYNDVLVIKVKNSVWIQELQYMKPHLLEKIRKSLPETRI